MSDRIERRLTAILAADVVGFSARMETDEAGTLDRLRRYRRDLIDPGLEKHRGRMIKTMGDGVLMEFASVVDAVNFAVEFQHGIASLSLESDAPEMLYRIGINLGDVMIEEGDVFGDGVNVAARLEPLAEPGGVLVSAAVVDQVRELDGARFEEMGERRLKNIKREVRVYRVVGTLLDLKRLCGAPGPNRREKPKAAIQQEPMDITGPCDIANADRLARLGLRGCRPPKKALPQPV
jgi:class 3 adenylate cyclase